MHLTTGKRQPLQVSMSTYANNLTGSKELSQTLRHMRIGIPYNDTLNELSAWWPLPKRRLPPFATYKITFSDFILGCMSLKVSENSSDRKRFGR